MEIRYRTDCGVVTVCFFFSKTSIEKTEFATMIIFLFGRARVSRGTDAKRFRARHNDEKLLRAVDKNFYFILSDIVY